MYLDLCSHQATLERKRSEYYGFVEQYFPQRNSAMHQDTYRQIHIDIPRMNPLIPLFQKPVRTLPSFAAVGINLFTYPLLTVCCHSLTYSTSFIVLPIHRPGCAGDLRADSIHLGCAPSGFRLRSRNERFSHAFLCRLSQSVPR